MALKIHLVIIDAQNSFMDYLRGSLATDALIPYGNCDRDRMILPDGTEFLSALPVPGALKDTDRTIAMIERLGNKIGKITVTFDTHPHRHISLTDYWRDRNGKRVKGMTPVRLDDVKNGIIVPFHQHDHVAKLGNQSIREITLAYLEALEAKGRQHMIWNEHCIAGTWGHNLHPGLTLALSEWEAATGRQVNRLTKGTFMFAEHFGPFEAEIPSNYAPETQLQQPYIESLATDDIVLFVGQARTHCVLTGLRQVVDNFDPSYLDKIWVADDAMSNIPAAGPGPLDFPATADAFFNGIFSQGVHRTDTVSFLS